MNFKFKTLDPLPQLATTAACDQEEQVCGEVAKQGGGRIFGFLKFYFNSIYYSTLIFKFVR
jgi:hypothetical protein